MSRPVQCGRAFPARFSHMTKIPAAECILLMYPTMMCICVAGQEDFGNTEGAVIIIGSGIAGLSSAASLHKVSLAPYHKSC